MKHQNIALIYLTFLVSNEDKSKFPNLKQNANISAILVTFCEFNEDIVRRIYFHDHLDLIIYLNNTV